MVHNKSQAPPVLNKLNRADKQLSIILSNMEPLVAKLQLMEKEIANKTQLLSGLQKKVEWIKKKLSKLLLLQI